MTQAWPYLHARDYIVGNQNVVHPGFFASAKAASATMWQAVTLSMKQNFLYVTDPAHGDITLIQRKPGLHFSLFGEESKAGIESIAAKYPGVQPDGRLFDKSNRPLGATVGIAIKGKVDPVSLDDKTFDELVASVGEKFGRFWVSGESGKGNNPMGGWVSEASAPIEVDLTKMKPLVPPSPIETIDLTPQPRRIAPNQLSDLVNNPASTTAKNLLTGKNVAIAAGAAVVIGGIIWGVRKYKQHQQTQVQKVQQERLVDKTYAQEPSGRQR